MRIKQRTAGSDGYGELRAALSAAHARAHQFLLNLADVPYMDSTGLGELVSVFITVRNHKGTLKLVTLTDRMRELFEVAKLVQVFDVFHDEADTLQSF